jgi:hypothetical protein
MLIVRNLRQRQLLMKIRISPVCQTVGEFRAMLIGDRSHGRY